MSETNIVPPAAAAPSQRSLLKATTIALVVAIIVLATAVLPAEYGIDPLGTGKATGLINMATPTVVLVPKTAAAGGPVANQPNGYKVDAIEFTLIPNGSVEYKYHLLKGATMVYSWDASSTVDFDMHTEPDKGGAAASDSFEAGQATAKHGTYTAPYDGIHGWFWQNKGKDTVTIVVKTAGFYDKAKMFDETGTGYDMDIKDAPGPEPLQ